MNPQNEARERRASCSPPLRCSPPPSMNSFTIPKRVTNKELLIPVSLDSRECKEVIDAVQSSLWNPQSYSFEFKSCEVVNNALLEEEFKLKRKEMGKDSRTTGYGFLSVNNRIEGRLICDRGLYTSNVHHTVTIGDRRYGVYLCRCADVLSRRMTLDLFTECTVVVFKVLMGRLKSVEEQCNGGENVLEPTPDYDGHVSKNFQRGKKRSLAETFDSTQMYLYEINLDNISSLDDAAIYSKRPKQVQPIALLNFHAKRKVPLPLKPATKTPAPLTQSTLSSDTPTENSYTSYFQHIKLIWSGFCFIKTQLLADVRLGVFNEMTILSPIPLETNLCVSQKISMQKLTSILPNRIFRKNPCESRQAEAVVEGLCFLHGELHPINLQDKRLEKFHAHLLKKKEVGVCTYNSGMKLYIIPTCGLTEQLGISNPSYPSILHCLFMKSNKERKIRSEYEHFIKQASLALKGRGSENELLKTVHPKNIPISTFAFKPINRIQIKKLLTSAKQAYERKFLDQRTRKEVSIETPVNGVQDYENLSSDESDNLVVALDDDDVENPCCEDPLCKENNQSSQCVVNHVTETIQSEKSEDYELVEMDIVDEYSAEQEEKEQSVHFNDELCNSDDVLSKLKKDMRKQLSDKSLAFNFQDLPESVSLLERSPQSTQSPMEISDSTSEERHHRKHSRQKRRSYRRSSQDKSRKIHTEQSLERSPFPIFKPSPMHGGEYSITQKEHSEGESFDAQQEIEDPIRREGLEKTILNTKSRLKDSTKTMNDVRVMDERMKDGTENDQMILPKTAEIRVKMQPQKSRKNITEPTFQNGCMNIGFKKMNGKKYNDESNNEGMANECAGLDVPVVNSKGKCSVSAKYTCDNGTSKGTLPSNAQLTNIDNKYVTLDALSIHLKHDEIDVFTEAFVKKIKRTSSL